MAFYRQYRSLGPAHRGRFEQIAGFSVCGFDVPAGKSATAGKRVLRVLDQARQSFASFLSKHSKEFSHWKYFRGETDL